MRYRSWSQEGTSVWREVGRFAGEIVRKKLRRRRAAAVPT
jgi:hypothetical protein